MKFRKLSSFLIEAFDYCDLLSKQILVDAIAKASSQGVSNQEDELKDKHSNSSIEIKETLIEPKSENTTGSEPSSVSEQGLGTNSLFDIQAVEKKYYVSAIVSCKLKMVRQS